MPGFLIEILIYYNRSIYNVFAGAEAIGGYEEAAAGTAWDIGCGKSGVSDGA